MAGAVVAPASKTMLTDEELCKRLGISYATLHNHLKNGPPTKRHTDVPDVRTIDYVVRGGQRRWLVASVDAFCAGS